MAETSSTGRIMHKDGRPFRAVVVKHGWRGAACLCIGAEGYSADSFVCVIVDDVEQFPVGTLFDLVRVDADGYVPRGRGDPKALRLAASKLEGS